MHFLLQTFLLINGCMNVRERGRENRVGKSIHQHRHIINTYIWLQTGMKLGSFYSIIHIKSTPSSLRAHESVSLWPHFWLHSVQDRKHPPNSQHQHVLKSILFEALLRSKILNYYLFVFM